MRSRIGIRTFVFVLVLDGGIAAFRMGLEDPHLSHNRPIEVWFSLSYDATHDENRSDICGAQARILMDLHHVDATPPSATASIPVLPCTEFSEELPDAYGFLGGLDKSPPPRF